jgi:hypothetical protein
VCVGGSGVSVGVGFGVEVGGGGDNVLVGRGREDPPPPGLGVFVGGGGVKVGEGIKTWVGVGVGIAAAVANMARRLGSIGVSVGRCVVGLDVGLAVRVAVGEGVAVGVRVAVAAVVTRTVGVAVAVAVRTAPPLTPRTSNETTVARDARPTNMPTPRRRLIRSPVMPLHGRSTFDFAGPASMVVSIAEGAMLSAFPWVGIGEPNSARYISAMLWNRWGGRSAMAFMSTWSVTSLTSSLSCRRGTRTSGSTTRSVAVGGGVPASA